MKLNLPFYRPSGPLSNRGTPSGQRRTHILQRLGGRMFFSWAEVSAQSIFSRYGKRPKLLLLCATGNWSAARRDTNRWCSLQRRIRHPRLGRAASAPPAGRRWKRRLPGGSQRESFWSRLPLGFALGRLYALVWDHSFHARFLPATASFCSGLTAEQHKRTDGHHEIDGKLPRRQLKRGVWRTSV